MADSYFDADYSVDEQNEKVAPVMRTEGEGLVKIQIKTRLLLGVVVSLTI